MSSELNCIRIFQSNELRNFSFSSSLSQGKLSHIRQIQHQQLFYNLQIYREGKERGLSSFKSRPQLYVKSLETPAYCPKSFVISVKFTTYCLDHFPVDGFCINSELP